jgi:hypothetical protein
MERIMLNSALLIAHFEFLFSEAELPSRVEGRFLALTLGEANTF